MKKQCRIIGRTGFTLIELLCSVIIVLTLATMLLPSNCQRARERARRNNCLANLKQIGLLAAIYAEENQGRCPTDSAIPTLIGSIQLYSNYVGSAKIFFCPSDNRGGKAQLSFSALTTAKSGPTISYSYVPNQMWTTNHRFVDILALDRIYTTRAGNPWPADGNHGKTDSSVTDVGGNVLFIDGRVEWHTTLRRCLRNKDGHEIVLSP